MKRVLIGGVVLAAVMALSNAPAMARGFGGPHGRGEDHFGGRGYAYHDRGFRGGFGFDIRPGFGYYGGAYAYPYYYAPDYVYPGYGYAYPGYYGGFYYHPHYRFAR